MKACQTKATFKQNLSTFPTNLVPRASYLFDIGIAVKYYKKVRCPGNEVDSQQS